MQAFGVQTSRTAGDQEELIVIMLGLAQAATGWWQHPLQLAHQL
jgi:hypothetical protein